MHVCLNACVFKCVCVCVWGPFRVQERNLCATIRHLHSWRFSPGGELIRFLLTEGCWGRQISSAYTHTHTHAHTHTLPFLALPPSHSTLPPSPFFLHHIVFSPPFSLYLPSHPSPRHLLIYPPPVFLYPCPFRGLPTLSHTVKGIVAQRSKRGISEPQPNLQDWAKTEGLHRMNKLWPALGMCACVWDVADLYDQFVQQCICEIGF